MMLAHDPRQRPISRLICQGFEDNVIFPKTLNAPTDVSHLAAGGVRDNHTGYPSTREVVQRWVAAERERIGSSICVSTMPSRTPSHV
jgi:hypothetical protein